MLSLKVLIKILFITTICQSLNITQPSNRNHKNLGNHRKRTSHKDAVSNIENRTTTTFLEHQQQPGHSNIYPVQYRFNKPLIQTRLKRISNLYANQQPVSAVSFESEILHEIEKTKQPSTPLVNFNKTAGANRLRNNKQKEYPRYQRYLKKNHDDKLIEQNIEVIQQHVNDDDRDQPNKTTATALSLTAINQPPAKTSHEIRYLHDIFLNYPKPHHVNFGHTELSPNLFEKRFESQKAGNRYKGKIMWLDNTGGFAQHYWNLAQGRL